MPKQFDGKVALVTGGGSGIGREVALAFAREGANVVITDVVDGGAHETVQMVQDQHGVKALFVRADVSVPAQMEAAVAKAVEVFGRLDYACNNAGIGGPAAPTGEHPVDGWNKVIAINLSGVFYSMRYEIPAMLKGGKGAIVNISSILGKVAFAGSPGYVAAKHGVVGLTETAAAEYATAGIRVNAICPGFINTPLVSSAGIATGSDTYNFIAGLHPMKRFGNPNEIAEAVVWLCSDAASFVTGASLAVDGGYLAV